MTKAADERMKSMEAQMVRVREALEEEQQRSRDMAAMEQKVNHFEVVAEQITLAMEQKIEDLEEQLRRLENQ